MRDADLEAVRAGYEAFARRDIEALLELVHPELTLHTYSDGTFHGHDGLRTWIASMDEAWEDWWVSVDDVIDAGPRAIVVALLGGRSRLNKIETSLRFWIVWEVRDGKPFAGRHLIDREAALAAARAPLSEPSRRP